MKRLYCALFLIFFLPSVAASAEYVVAHDVLWPPFELLDETNQISGYCVDYIAAVGQEANFTVVRAYIPRDGIFARLIKGEVHIVASPVSITEKRTQSISFSQPYFVTNQCLVLSRSSTATKLEDLNGTIVGVQNGTTSQTVANRFPGLTVKPYDELREAIDELVAGKIAGIVTHAHVARHFASMPAYKNMIWITNCSITNELEAYGFVVKKEDKALLQKINNGIAAVKQKGIDRAIYAKWFGQADNAPDTVTPPQENLWNAQPSSLLKGSP